MCQNRECSLSLNALRIGVSSQPRQPQGTVSFVEHLQVSPTQTRSIVALRSDWVLVHLMIDSRYGCSEARKDTNIQGHITAGRLPEWPGDNCPRCGQVMRHHARSESRNCTLHRERPHLCVSSVVVNENGTMHVRVDSPTMPTMWLILEMPSSWLPPAPK